jgi:hypothetical protein
MVSLGEKGIKGSERLIAAALRQRDTLVMIIAWRSTSYTRRQTGIWGIEAMKQRTKAGSPVEIEKEATPPSGRNHIMIEGIHLKSQLDEMPAGIGQVEAQEGDGM